MDIYKEKQRLVVVSEILFQRIYFLKKSKQKKKKFLGGGISEKFCSNGGTMTHQILFYSR